MLEVRSLKTFKKEDAPYKKGDKPDKSSQCKGKAHKFKKKEAKQKAANSSNTERKLKLAKAYKTRIKEVSDWDRELNDSNE
jgi:hypothetical protein